MDWTSWAGLGIVFGSPWVVVGVIVRAIIKGSLVPYKALEDERLHTASERRDKEFWRDIALRSSHQTEKLLEVSDTTNEILKSLPLKPPEEVS